VPLIGEGVAAGMAEHVRVRLQPEASTGGGTLDQAGRPQASQTVTGETLDSLGLYPTETGRTGDVRLGATPIVIGYVVPRATLTGNYRGQPCAVLMGRRNSLITAPSSKATNLAK
jgi:hypothetical protein